MELYETLKKHEKWLSDEVGGVKADLRGANLSGVDLRWANLSEANLSCVDLSCVDLSWADLNGADLNGADLNGADLREANLRGADLRGVDIDYSSWPLSCGSLNVILCDKQKAQLLYHTIRVVGKEMFTQDQVDFANTFHRAGECGEI